MVDLHVHLLHGLDDGPRTVDDAFALARAIRAGGVESVVATPHYSDRFPTPHAAALERAAQLRSALDAADIDLTIHVGAEIALPTLDSLDDEQLRLRAVGEPRPYVLIESPFNDAPDALELRLHDLRAQGLRVLLAHPERSAYFQRDPALLKRLVDSGVLCSLTSGSLNGRFGRRVREFALRLLHGGQVHNLSSDAHDLTTRPPGLDAGVITEGQRYTFTHAVPCALIAGAPLPELPAALAVAPRRRRFRFLRRPDPA